ncbi:MAG: hypothetical protein KHX68_01630 [Roseburia sp.]|nr:hypothetical protein [Roseburia sp.]
MKATTLQRPPEWINRRYYEIQATESMPVIEENSDDFKVTLKEGIKIGIGAFTVYLIIAMAIIIL